MVNFFNFLCIFLFFPFFISNTSRVSINFGANLDAQNAGNDIFGIQISKIFWGQTPPIHACYIGHTRGLQPLLSPSNILSHRKVPFQKIPPPHGKILKKGPGTLSSLPGRVYSLYMNTPSWIKTSCPTMPLSHKQIYRVNSRRVYIGNPSSSSWKKFILFYNIVGTLGSFKS
jgi:hypothetical protein